MRFDVLVIGGGPSGSFLSGLLSEKGLKVALLDRKPVPWKRCCAGILGSEAFSAFSLPAESILRSVKHIVAFSPGGKSLSYKVSDPVAFVIDRKTFDGALLERSISKGTVFMGGVKALSVEREEGWVSVRCMRMGDGKRLSMKSRLAVISTGFNRGMIASLGLGGYPGFVFGIHAVYEMRDVANVEVYSGSRVAPGGFAWLVPETGCRVRLGLVTTSDRPLDVLKGFVSYPPVSSRIVACVVPRLVFPIPSGPIPRTFCENILVVGEAAGIVKTTTYGGIYYGLISSKIAGGVILEAFSSGDFSKNFLSRYEIMWKKRLWEEMEFGMKLRDIALKMDDSDIDRLFEFLSEGSVFSRVKGFLSFDWHKDAIKFLLKRGVLKKLFKF